jgi:hypothetical protein
VNLAFSEGQAVDSVERLLSALGRIRSGLLTPRVAPILAPARQLSKRAAKALRCNRRECFGAEAGTRTTTPVRALDPETGAGDEPALSFSA